MDEILRKFVATLQEEAVVTALAPNHVPYKYVFK
jgi:hypothetical protein